ncbi:MAG: hypothetical protein ACM3ZV_07375 [Bacillota bacterium]
MATRSAKFRAYAPRVLGRREIEEIIPGDFVRMWTGSPLGLVESVTGDHAVVASLGRWRERAIVPCALLTRASADPAFGPDVRGGLPPC